VLNPSALGVGVIAYVAVGLSQHTKNQQRSFEVAMSTVAAVRECHNVTGAFEYILRVEVEDLQAYKNFHSEVLGALPQVSSITSYIVMESTKDERA
jgi:Lrp/AsnC family transcriptional regulator, leucine-responsive regulatory protein